MDVRLVLTQAQADAVAALDSRQSVVSILQAHVDTWLAPLVAESVESERREVIEAYKNASPEVKEDVKGLLGLG